MDYEKFYNAYHYLLKVGFHLDKNSARDFIDCLHYVCENYDEFIKENENE